MSIASEIARLEQAKIDISAAIESKGGMVPNGTLINEMGEFIRTIEIVSYIDGSKVKY